MTRDETINVIHKTIYQFFDGGDGEPMSDKDKLLLEVNKTVCNNIKALEQEPSGDAISRQAALKLFATNDGCYLYEAIRDLPSVTPKQTEITLESAIEYLHSIGWMQKHDKEMTEYAEKQRTGHWIPVSERLPETHVFYNTHGKHISSDYVLVTVRLSQNGFHEQMVTVGRYSNNDWKLLYGNICGSIKAWMPLPKPYELQESEEQA